MSFLTLLQMSFVCKSLKYFLCLQIYFIAFPFQIPEKSSANDGVCLFKPHVSPVNCVKFSDYDQSTLFSSSYDGTVRRCDVNKQQFELVSFHRLLYLRHQFF